jgi:hypothetical protein
LGNRPEDLNMIRAFKGIFTESAMVAFTDAERKEIIENIIPLADEKDTGVHEGLVFNFDAHGKQWKVVVDIGARWVKILSKEEFDKAVQEAVSRN